MSKKICSCNSCPFGPGEDDLAPEKSMGLHTPDTFCGIGETDEDGAFVAAWRMPVYLPEGAKCSRLAEFEAKMAIRHQQEEAA